MRVAVVGSGIAGLASAAHLARAGHQVTIFERFAEPRPVGAGLLLQPSGLMALDTLDLRGEAVARGARVSRLIGRNARGRTVLDLRYSDARKGDYGVGIHRASLFNLLLDAAREAGAHWRTGADVVDIAAPDTDTPCLKLADGETTAPFDLILICDGAHSRLRRIVCPQARERVFPWGAFWAIRPDPEGAREGELEQVYDGCRIMIGLLPVGDNPADPQGRPGVSVFWSVRSTQRDAVMAAGDDAFREGFTRYWPRAGQAVGEAGLNDFAYAAYQDTLCPTWHRGRIMLLGDAAHAMSPQLGQGANLALCDAAALAAAMADHAPVQHALKAAERARRPSVTYYSLMSRALTPVFQSSSKLLGWARDIVFNLSGRLPGLRHWMGWTLTGRGRLPW